MPARRVVIVTVHYLESKRQADPHFIARAFRRLGWDVLFFTVSLSPLSKLRRDDRMQYPIVAEANRIKPVADGLSSFVWYRPYHPVNLRLPLLNRLSAPLFARYGDGPLHDSRSFLAGADLFVFESTAGIMMVPQLKRLNPRARYVYRVSDDMRVVGNHPVILEAEDAVASEFDLVSLPSRYMLHRFGNLPQAAVHPHGLDKSAFEGDMPNPYEPGTVNAISVGATLFDAEALALAAQSLPELRFHVFSWHRDMPEAPNIIQHGERPFAEVVPWIRHADVGLALYRWREGAEQFADSSLKIIQYTWCRLPVVAPSFAAAPENANVVGYVPGDRESIRAACERALAIDRRTIDVSRIRDWEQLAQHLAGGSDGGGDRPGGAAAHGDTDRVGQD
ncbi:MAG: hypothetical protein AB7K86_20475 [Rhodospirillales bacterium]